MQSGLCWRRFGWPGEFAYVRLCIRDVVEPLLSTHPRCFVVVHSGAIERRSDLARAQMAPQEE